VSIGLRRIVFWSHLIVGSGAGVVILVMAITGVLLTYERQIVEWTEQQYAVQHSPDVTLPADVIFKSLRERHSDEHHFFVRFVNRPGSAVSVWAGQHSYLVSPYTGEVLRVGQGVIANVFHVITDLHRSLAFGGDAKDLGGSLIGYSNLFFIFLILTGAYLWLPRMWKWPLLRSRILISTNAKWVKARNYNWHHAVGFWVMPPLLIIALSATLFSFSWTNTLLYGFYGEEVPVRDDGAEEIFRQTESAVSYQSLFERSTQHATMNGATDWYSIWMEVGENAGEVRFYIDRSIGRRPEFAYSLRLSDESGDVLEVKKHTDWSEGDQAWDAARFLHTGEVFGFVGQTIAGLASLGACVLVYTGLALSWRRFWLWHRVGNSGRKKSVSQSEL
jgi:uncharacterized iron-regulated membrane protein